MTNTRKLSYCGYKIKNIEHRLDDVWTTKVLKLIKFASTENNPFSMMKDLQLKFPEDIAEAITCYRFNKPASFEHHLNVGIKNQRKRDVEAKKEQEKAEKVAKKNLGKPFVGQILYDDWGYDATIIEYFKVTKVSKCFVWVKSVDNKAVFGDKTMRRKIHWDKNSHDYWIAVDSVRLASPWDGVYRQEDWND